MYKTITQNNFVDAFMQSDERKGQFTYNALVALFNYVEQSEVELGGPMEFDMVALCCEWTEYKNALECVENYLSFEWEAGDTTEENEERALEWLNDKTTVIKFDGGLLILNF